VKTEQAVEPQREATKVETPKEATKAADSLAPAEKAPKAAPKAAPNAPAFGSQAQPAAEAKQTHESKEEEEKEEEEDEDDRGLTRFKSSGNEPAATEIQLVGSAAAQGTEDVVLSTPEKRESTSIDGRSQTSAEDGKIYKDQAAVESTARYDAAHASFQCLGSCCAGVPVQRFFARDLLAVHWGYMEQDGLTLVSVD
jgi:hypothetical protein